MSNLLATQNLVFSYDHGIGLKLCIENLIVRSGEIHTLVGPNGSGKSTLLRLLAGILKPVSGEIIFRNESVARMPRQQFARHAAFLPQQNHPVQNLRVVDVVWMGRHPWMKGLGMGTSLDAHHVADAMQRMNVEGFSTRWFHTLSGGEQQRVLLASILAQNPEVILLDEPTSALDPHHQSEVMQLLLEEAGRNTGILFATHDLTLAGHFASQVTLLQKGRIAASGSPKEVLEEKRLRTVYGECIRVVPDSERGVPCILPVLPASGSPIPASLEKRVAHLPPHAIFRHPGLWLAMGLFALLVLIGAPCVGMEKIDPLNSLQEILSKPNDSWSISTRILELRLPRVGMGFLAGMTLACVGAAFQSLLRNPLAEPYTLGMAGWASLGAVIAITFPALSFTFGPISGTQLWAWGFALIGMALLSSLTHASHNRSGTSHLLLSGITLGLLSGAIIGLIRFLANPFTARAMDQWMIGGLDVTSWAEVAPVLPFLIPGLVLLLVSARNLGQIEAGEELAAGRGVEVTRVQRQVFIGGSLATAAVVAVTGPIGFVGLLVPHMARKIVESDPRAMLPASMLLGGTLLVTVDTLARSLEIAGRGAELPVGILTSLMGAPLFLALLWKRRM